ncbi:MAG TPA: exodeoxyribonuclease V subunit beta, partial [Gammaproteobacteria bacterium]|nr:exodeoxyribonuclease V subunit beta [Gammaproteobacteria bacterium]
SPAIAERLLDFVADPAALLDRIRKRLSGEVKLLPPSRNADDIVDEIESSLVALTKAHARLKALWPQARDTVEEFLYNNTGKNGNSYRASGIDKAWSAVEELCTREAPMLSPWEKLELVSADVMAGKMKKNHAPPSAPVFDAVADYLAILADIDPLFDALQIAFLSEARSFVRDHMDRAKRRAHQLYFDDLLTRLDQALRGEGGEALAQRLREQYPLAMIDEFQDTDAVQYRIFHAIYGEEKTPTTLCLIGDPKQAIYGFRGGDIYTYLAASNDARRRYSLDTNWRSASRLVEAVNTLFGASDNPFRQKAIPYHPVKPSPNADAEPLRIDGTAPVPLQFWKLKADDGALILADDARAAAAEACARHIAQLLQPGRASLGDRPLRAADIAVLVRSHSQVAWIQDALRAEGVNSVSLSETSVYRTEEADALLALLQAVLRCEDEALLRFALADRLLGHTAREIEALIGSDDAWDAVQQRFFGYRDRWRDNGFVQAFQQLFRDEGIAPRLLRLPDGERRLTNLLQLVELLQQASRRHPGMEELLRWFAEEKAQASAHDAAKMRLESDQALVKIVTMHASKGLEYPVVYIPFPWASDPAENAPFYFHDENDTPCLHLGVGEKEDVDRAKSAASEEALAEKMRLFYVAVTRAAQLCVLTWGKVNKAQGSALASLLDIGAIKKDTPENEVFEKLEKLAASAPGAITLCDPPAAEATQPKKTADAAPPLTPRQPPKNIERDWRVNSYSSLLRGSASDQPDHDAVASAAPIIEASSDPIQNLPAGAEFGLLTHQTLELLDFAEAGQPQIAELIEKLSRRYAIEDLREAGSRDALAAMIANLLDTPLPPAGLRLRELTRRDRLDEMEFHFASARVSPSRLRATLAPFPEWRGAADHLDFPAFQGLMHGYIDLVFRHDGRYWLADYKSNRLEDYGQAGLDAAMTAHHYPLQALIYSLALHRYLRQRLPDYQPERHFGGVFYLFTRGVRPDSDGGVWFRQPDAALLDALDACFSQREAA